MLKFKAIGEPIPGIVSSQLPSGHTVLKKYVNGHCLATIFADNDTLQIGLRNLKSIRWERFNETTGEFIRK